MNLLTVRNLGIILAESRRALLDGVSFEIQSGERVGLIGESGSGKSITALAVLGLLPESMMPSGRITLAGTEMIGGSEESMRRVRGSAAAMIFQEPLSALDPLMRVGRQIEGPVSLHQGLRGTAARDAVMGLLARVKLPDPQRIASSFPHELSGGQRQRVALAMALACRPSLLIADEPTTALDVTVQAEVLALLDELVTADGMALLFITHDLPVIARVARKLLVMEDGRVVESGEAGALLRAPRHPSTARLLEAARQVTALRYARGGA
ncbi:MAG TPA: ABC transporter ATP-binding protein [Spirochaetia bacterium]|nr:ABC transporter ATP-binding protein [Spirochaetia bacterium]